MSRAPLLGMGQGDLSCLENDMTLATLGKVNT